LKDPITLADARALGESDLIARDPARLLIAIALSFVADVLLFIAALSGGMPVSLAHITSFGCATAITYFLTVRWVVPGKQREPASLPRVCGHLVLVAFAALWLRAGVLSLLMGWGLSAQWAIVFAAAAAAAVTQVGSPLYMKSGRWMLGRGTRWRTLAFALITCAVLLRLIYGSQVELLPEEAYYWNYSRHLDIGYLDHPPMVAWLIRLGTAVFGNTEFGIRIGAVCSGAVASFFVYRLTRELFDEASALVALVLMQLLPFFFFAGILMTPDAPLTAAWAASLFYLRRALIAGRAAAWWPAGLWLGLGLLSKYTIAMLVPAMLLFMIGDGQSRQWLRHWRPYAAGLLALVIFSPVIFWNATHDWASFVFQTSRRLAEAPRFSLHKLFLSVLILLTPVGLVSVVGMFWGKGADAAASATQQRRYRRFLQSCILTPLLVFFIFSLRHEVKFDWTGALWTAAVPLLSSMVVSGGDAVAVTGSGGWGRNGWVTTLVILLFIYGAAFHYFVLGLPGVGYSTHMELVPVGWRRLGEQVSVVEDDVRRRTGSAPLVVGLDRYETASELAFYAPDQARSVGGTSSDSLFGGLGLMYKRWFPERAQIGRNILLVGWSEHDLDKAEIHERFQRLEPVTAATLARDGHIIRHYYYRLGIGYQTAADSH
jgi:dolichol-phosphate mannosyltransferase